MSIMADKTDRELFEDDLTDVLIDLLWQEVKKIPWSKFDGTKDKCDVCPERYIQEARVYDPDGEIVHRSGLIDLSSRDWDYKVSYTLDGVDGSELVYRLRWES